MADVKPGLLEGLRVLEYGDEAGEYCGLLMAGMGADVVKVEPPQGNPTRSIGPFAGDQPDPERSLFFWNFNRRKRSVALALDEPGDREDFLALAAGADVLLDASNGRLARLLHLDRHALLKRFPSLVLARITPFGDDGPWAGYKGSDLVHLALGGVMMNCGYDANPQGHYDLPPVAPQLWHAWQITGEQMLIAILGALLHRNRTGQGQDLSCAVHEAVSKSTELDLMSWVMRRATLYRQTCRHSTEQPGHVPVISHTKDGRWLISWQVSKRDQANLVPFLARYGMAADLQVPEGGDLLARDVPGSTPMNEQKAHIAEVVQRFVRAWRYDDVPWKEAQEAGLLWSPLRRPHENASDEHWRMRGSIAEVEHPELGRSCTYPVSKWLSTATEWKAGPRAPRVGEHTQAVRRDWTQPRKPVRVAGPASPPRTCARGQPFALQGVRIFDFSWFLASAGGTRFCAALGAECLKVEWKGNPDTRLGAQAPIGGRAARAAATAPLKGDPDPSMGGQFNNKNTGKRGLSLNVRHPKGLAIAKDLIRISDVVAEGFSPGVLERLGLGYEVLRSIRPDIIYVQQSGMGGQGLYGRMRTVGPIAAAMTGLSEMSGLPEPHMPAGWGYSYLDWMGAYGFAQAVLAALYHRDRTGQGQWIDSSQCEAGFMLTGTALLDWSVNGREWRRIGNRSPYKPAAPHGAYRCQGEDRWLAIACFDDAEWRALAHVAGREDWLADARFATLESRLRHQDALDRLVGAWTATQEPYACMDRLQHAGVPAGVCQTAEDRCDRDPQLKHLAWLTEVRGTRIGEWPLAEFPVKLSATPAHVGGLANRGAPYYGEDNEYVLGQLLGYSMDEITKLAEEGVI